jgi:hypothetical protein
MHHHPPPRRFTTRKGFPVAIGYGDERLAGSAWTLLSNGNSVGPAKSRTQSVASCCVLRRVRIPEHVLSYRHDRDLPDSDLLRALKYALKGCRFVRDHRVTCPLSGKPFWPSGGSHKLCSASPKQTNSVALSPQANYTY